MSYLIFWNDNPKPKDVQITIIIVCHICHLSFVQTIYNIYSYLSLYNKPSILNPICLRGATLLSLLHIYLLRICSLMLSHLHLILPTILLSFKCLILFNRAYIELLRRVLLQSHSNVFITHFLQNIILNVLCLKLCIIKNPLSHFESLKHGIIQES